MNFFPALSERAVAAGLPFLVIGGNAVIAYGYPRTTRDFDLLVRDADRRAWDTLITALGYTRHQVAKAFHMYNPIDRSLPPVDLMLVDEATFSKLSTDARRHEIEGVSVHLPHLAHLIALKLHALRFGGEHRRELDLGDIVTLVRVNKIDLAAGEYREILDRYATESIREELIRRLDSFGSESPGA